jgi:site-specific recombinase XerD
VAPRLRSSLAPESIAGYVRGLKAFGNWCAAEEVAAAASFRGLRRPKVPRRLIAPFSDPELRSLLAVADEHEQALALVLLDTGLRLSELVSLRVGDVRSDGTLHVMGKGARERIVPIGASARRALVRYLATRAAVAADDPLFCGAGAWPSRHAGSSCRRRRCRWTYGLVGAIQARSRFVDEQYAGA